MTTNYLSDFIRSFTERQSLNKFTRSAERINQFEYFPDVKFFLLLRINLTVS